MVGTDSLFGICNDGNCSKCFIQSNNFFNFQDKAKKLSQTKIKSTKPALEGIDGQCELPCFMGFHKTVHYLKFGQVSIITCPKKMSLCQQLSFCDWDLDKTHFLCQFYQGYIFCQIPQYSSWKSFLILWCFWRVSPLSIANKRNIVQNNSNFFIIYMKTILFFVDKLLARN